MSGTLKDEKCFENNPPRPAGTPPLEGTIANGE
jgi:hypothetical protein